MGKPFEDWRRQEPGARDTPKDKRNRIKSQIEREQMEQRNRLPFTLWFVGDSLQTFFRLRDKDSIRSFQVSLRSPLTIAEIKQRMEKGFGDLAERET